MCLILDNYGVMTVFSFPYTPSCERRLSAGTSLFLASYRQSPLVISTLEMYLRRGGLVCPSRFTTERQPVLLLAVAFSKISFKRQ
ncbi:hypothetical protein B7P43_G00607 [Cryptotermes secundus]|uniref:Uncharacterized protein n=1 Tax=Cryptotermes secundus TaxID=105785 RepID=A0A2J7PUY7_9NEOP|nr:hypothetical protein B7P43_G00607 [Cryptotermes secundus]